ncbi:MAG: hypothetical protein JNL67_00015 [Planctomycetaceae bacterium]|nr:hypothetical protein [Planctomycetaceae bacterium]
MKIGIYCPYCAAELVDPAAERCVCCGMFVTHELRAALSMQVPTARAVPPTSNPDSAAMTGGGAVLEGIPVASLVSDVAGHDLRRWSESSASEWQQSLVVWKTILFQSSIGLTLWAWAIVSLGRLGYMPYAWAPAFLAIIVGLFGMSPTNRWFSLGAIAAAFAVVPVSGWIS